MKRLIFLALLLILVKYFANASCCYLAIPSAFQNPEAKKKIIDALETAKSLKEGSEKGSIGTKQMSVEGNEPEMNNSRYYQNYIDNN